MIDDIDGVKFQLARLSGMPGYPKDPVARGELIRIACATAPAIDAVRRAVDLIVNEFERCPVPSALRKVIFGCLPPRAKRQCVACEGVGYLVFPFLITRERDVFTGKSRKAAVKITRIEERELQPKLFALYAGSAMSPQEIVDGAEKCGCTA